MSAIAAGRARQHVVHEPFMSRHVDEADDLAARPGPVGEAEVDGDAARLLLLEAIGVDAGELADQRGLAVIDVAPSMAWPSASPTGRPCATTWRRQQRRAPRPGRCGRAGRCGSWGSPCGAARLYHSSAIARLGLPSSPLKWKSPSRLWASASPAWAAGVSHLSARPASRATPRAWTKQRPISACARGTPAWPSCAQMASAGS